MEISAEIFLLRRLAGTLLGVILGLIATPALCVVTAGIIHLLLRWTGRDFWWLNGRGECLHFRKTWLFMPPLGIAPSFSGNALAHIGAWSTCPFLVRCKRLF